MLKGVSHLWCKTATLPRRRDGRLDRLDGTTLQSVKRVHEKKLVDWENASP